MGARRPRTANCAGPPPCWTRASSAGTARAYVAKGADPARPGAAPVLAKPAQLPPDPAAFVGRCELLKVLADALVPIDDPACVPPVSLIGPAGVGKSSLAIRLAHRVKDL